MTRAKRISIRLRWVLLILWLLCLAAGITWLVGPYFDWGAGLIGTPLSVLWMQFDDSFFQTSGLSYPLLVLIYLGLFFFTQWLFLGPRTLWKISVTETPRPMKKAAVAAAFAAALLLSGLVYSILDLFSFFDKKPSTVIYYLVISIPLILWLIWSLVFCLYLRQRDYYTWAGRIIRALIAGSILELFVSIPIYVTRKEECYCARASYTGLIFGATALLWAFGPAVFFLFLREKHRIEKLTPPPEQQPPPPI